MTKSQNIRDLLSRAEAKAAGLKRAFTGKPCKNGHVGWRLVSNWGCLDCVAVGKKERDRAYCARNAEKARERAREWRLKNPERAQENDRNKHAAKRDQELARMRARYAENRDADIARKKTHYHANADAERAKTRARYAANPAAWLVGSRNRKARKRQAEGSHTAAEILALFDAQNGKCANCRCSIKRGYHADHIQPLSRGGSNWIRNIQLLCAPCNLRKRAHDPIDFARMEGRLV